MPKRQPTKTPKKEKRINWGRGSPRKKMKKALEAYDREEGLLQLKAHSEGWGLQKINVERSKLRKKICKDKLGGKGLEALKKRINCKNSCRLLLFQITYTNSASYNVRRR